MRLVIPFWAIWTWQTLRLLTKRFSLYCGIVGRRWHVGRIGPRTAWQVACVVHPWENRWNGALDGRKGGEKNNPFFDL